MRNAVDFSGARPDPAELAAAQLDVLVYTGNARPDTAYIQALRSAGVGVCMVQESDPNRSQQGAGAGAEDARYADQRADEVGYPASCAIAYVVSDGNANDPHTGAGQIAAYAQAVAGTSKRPVFFYGNQYACDAAMSGAPGALGTWIPSTWGTGTLLTQEANTASPFANTDLNTVHAPYGSWTDDVEDDMFTDDDRKTLTDIEGWLSGGSQYPPLEQRIVSGVLHGVGELLGKLPDVKGYLAKLFPNKASRVGD